MPVDRGSDIVNPAHRVRDSSKVCEPRRGGLGAFLKAKDLRRSLFSCDVVVDVDDRARSDRAVFRENHIACGLDEIRC